MANEFVEVVSLNANKQVQDLIRGLDEVKKRVNSINATKINLPSDARVSGSNASGASAQANRLLLEQERLILRVTDARKKEAIANAGLKIELSQLNKENKAAAAQTVSALNSYQKLDSELGQLRLSAKGLAADMFLLEQAGQQTSQEYLNLANSYDIVSKRVNTLDAGLKKIDTNLGQNTRFVGEYGRSWNGLGNSINQITREFPAFTFSMQTGFLALSNNIPILADEISNLVAKNNELIAQGKPTVSVFKQIAGALFSWQTALSLGITILTVYGKEISTFVANLFKTQKALNSITETQKILNNVRLQSKKDIIDEITTIGLYLQTAKDVSKSDAERAIAVRKLQNEYSFYFGKLSESEILLGKTAKAEAEVNKAIEARQNTLGVSEQYNENQQKLVNINNDLVKAQRTVSTEQARQTALKKAARAGDIGAIEATERLLNSYDTENAAIASTNNLTKQKNYYNEINNKLIQEAIKYKKDSIGLEYQEETAKKLSTQATVDYIASQYELIQLRLQNEASMNQRVFEDEATNFERREQAAKRYADIQKEIADNTLAESLRVLERNRDQETKSLNQRVKDGEISERNRNEVVYTLQKQYQYDSLVAYENYAEALRQIDLSREESMRGVWNAINFQKAETLIDERELQNNRDYAKTLQDIVKGNKDYREIEKANKQFQLASRDITKANIQVEIDRIETELRAIKDTEANVQKRLSLQNQLIDKQKELSNVTITETQEQAAAFEKLQKATESYLNTFTEGFLSESGLSGLNTFFKIEENGKTMFDNLIEGANTTTEKFAVAFNAISELAQQTFAFLSQNSQAYFQGQYEALAKEKEIALKFAGESTAGREEIETQYEERRKAIRRKEAESQKEQALFNAIINTAQAVVAALPNVALSVIIGAIGAAQIAMIASQQIPQFKDGVKNFGGGLAVVGDGGRSEIIQTASGELYKTPSTDTLVNLPKGSNVYKSELDFVRNSGGLYSNISSMPVQNNSISRSEMQSIMDNSISKVKPFNMAIDKNGMRSWIGSERVRTENMNNIVSFKSVKV